MIQHGDMIQHNTIDTTIIDMIQQHTIDIT